MKSSHHRFLAVITAALLPAAGVFSQSSTPQFQGARVFPLNLASLPKGVATGDFNGDGKPDLATANFFTYNISVCLGDGAGGFAPNANYAVSDGGTTLLTPNAVATGDFNGDGKTDLVVGSRKGPTGEITILLGNGAGGMVVGSRAAITSDVRALVVGDFNRDGRLDVASANGGSDVTSYHVAILSGNGAGTLGTPTYFLLPDSPEALASGDLNGDAYPDFVAATGSGAVSVLLSNGAGGFRPPAAYAVGLNPRSVVMGDWNGDAKPDLAVANAYSNSVSLLLNNGLGVFGATTRLTTQPLPVFVCSTDFDADGRPDLAVLSQGESATPPAVSIFLGRGAGTFGAPTHFAAGPPSAGGVIADFNSDGRPDVATANGPEFTGFTTNNVGLFLNAGAGTLRTAPRVGTSAAPDLIATGDFNGDGKADITTANRAAKSFSLFGGDGAGGYVPRRDFSVAASPTGVAAGDFNEDGKDDLAVANGRVISLAAGDAAGGFATLVETTLSDPVAALVRGDFNGDGHLDLVVSSSSKTWFLRGDGSRAFTVVLLSIAATPVAAGDFTGDGKLDFLAASGGLGRVFRGDGLGAFDRLAAFPLGEDASRVAVGDFNGDGKLDVVATGTSDGRRGYVVLGDGAGGFGAPILLLTGLDSFASAVADFDGDAIADVAITNTRGQNTLTILAGFSGGNFRSVTTYAGGLGSYDESLLAPDLNGDGKADLVLATPASRHLQTWLKTPTGYAGWVATLYPSVTGGPGADHEYDGIANGLEYAFGLNPTAPDSAGVLPRPLRNGDHLIVTFSPPAGLTGVNYGGSWSRNLIDWFPAIDTGSGGAHIFSISILDEPRFFFRHVVEIAP